MQAVSFELPGFIDAMDFPLEKLRGAKGHQPTEPNAN